MNERKTLREGEQLNSIFLMWVVGLLLLKLWFRMTMAGFAVPPTPPEWATALRWGRVYSYHGLRPDLSISTLATCARKYTTSTPRLDRIQYVRE